ncbi:hypothetical protein [Antarcticirhabdus aurantiaca]|uniref:Uncharacterized protein n=1 Tax=Antarcticirhabdus aurantiaca TaxID=2606717 RepID=A0ACD4NX23_9HYPH|nr:hypothetical protein [Antarcticirhabdus aurantiaca]WAJ31288.1 hypothetical protein OXU80_14240 [Jeongeuplla avenae]
MHLERVIRMNDVQEPAGSLHLLTIEAVLDDLTGGRALALADGLTLSLGDDPRSALDWYRRN